MCEVSDGLSRMFYPIEKKGVSPEFTNIQIFYSLVVLLEMPGKCSVGA